MRQLDSKVPREDHLPTEQLPKGKKQQPLNTDGCEKPLENGYLAKGFLDNYESAHRSPRFACGQCMTWHADKFEREAFHSVNVKSNF